MILGWFLRFVSIKKKIELDIRPNLLAHRRALSFAAIRYSRLHCSEPFGHCRMFLHCLQCAVDTFCVVTVSISPLPQVVLATTHLRSKSVRAFQVTRSSLCREVTCPLMEEGDFHNGGCCCAAPSTACT